MSLVDTKLFVINVNLSSQDMTDSKGNKLIRKQSSLFLHGAKGTGKSTLLQRASGLSAQQVLDAEAHTIGGDNFLIDGKGSTPFFVGDYSGDDRQIDTDGRFKALSDLQPLAVLVLLDHAPRGENPQYEFDKIFTCPPNGELPTDKNHPIRKRFEENKKAILELKRVFEINPIVAEKCRLVLPIVNKWDAWRTLGYRTNTFLDWYEMPLKELNKTVNAKNITWHNPIPLSGLLEGFGGALKIIEERGGKEWVIKIAENPLFTILIRRATVAKPK